MRHRTLWIGIGVFVVACVVLGLLAAALVAGANHYVPMRPMIRSYHYPVNFYGAGRMLLGLLFWGVIIGGGALLIAGLISRGRHQQTLPFQPPARRDESAMEILRRRYARGEITREEYDMMKETLTRDTPTEGTGELHGD